MVIKSRKSMGYSIGVSPRFCFTFFVLSNRPRPDSSPATTPTIAKHIAVTKPLLIAVPNESRKKSGSPAATASGSNQQFWVGKRVHFIRWYTFPLQDAIF
jgi:hypothetical protein